MIAAPAIDERAAVAALVSRIMQEHGESLQLLTEAEVCGILNIDRRTLESVGIPRITIKPGKYCYRAADLNQFLTEKTA